MRKYKELDIRVLILSRGRSKWIKTHRLLPFATLVVPESEVEEYKWTGNEIEPVPDEIIGLGPLRNWCLEHFREEVIVMADDDIQKVWVNVGELGHAIYSPETIRQILINTAEVAYDVGARCFGFAQAWDVRKYTQPFSMVGWVGGVIGVIGKDVKFDATKKYKVDVDFCLKQLLINRIVWIDNRYAFVQDRGKRRGGNSLTRTKEDVDKEIEALIEKWGKYIEIKRTKTGEVTKIKVER